jgi:hypothetical protein
MPTKKKAQPHHAVHPAAHVKEEQPMAEEIETKPQPETPTTGDPPKPGPVPGTKEFDDEVKAGDVIHSPDPTKASPGTVQEEEREKNENEQSKK